MSLRADLARRIEIGERFVQHQQPRLDHQGCDKPHFFLGCPRINCGYTQLPSSG